MKAVAGSEEWLRAHVSMARFSLQLYLNTKARMESNEWLSFKKIFTDREAEYHRCNTMRKVMEAEIGTNFKENVEYKSLMRFFLGLQREIGYDRETNRAVEEAYSTNVMKAITNFGSVLKVSKEADLDVVFQVVNLWFTNNGNPDVNEAMLDIIRDTPSYKFAPLAYQIFSRLGDLQLGDIASSSSTIKIATPVSTASLSTTAKRKSITSSSSSSSAAAAASSLGTKVICTSFAYVLNRLILKLCVDHPHHILPILFALAHESSLLGSAIGAQVRYHTTRCTYDALTLHLRCTYDIKSPYLYIYLSIILIYLLVLNEYFVFSFFRLYLIYLFIYLSMLPSMQL